MINIKTIIQKSGKLLDFGTAICNRQPKPPFININASSSAKDGKKLAGDWRNIGNDIRKAMVTEKGCVPND